MTWLQKNMEFVLAINSIWPSQGRTRSQSNFTDLEEELSEANSANMCVYCWMFFCTNTKKQHARTWKQQHYNNEILEAIVPWFPMMLIDFRSIFIARNSQLRWVLFESPSRDRWYLQCQLKSPRRRRHSSHRMEKTDEKMSAVSFGTRVWLECGHTCRIKIYNRYDKCMI